MSLFDIYKAKQLGAGAGSLFDAKAGGKLNKDAWKKGFNKWDEEWEEGGLKSPTGEKYNTSDRIRSKNYIPIIGGATYYRNAPNNIQVWYYDENYEVINVFSWGKNTTMAMPQNAKWALFQVDPAYGTTYKNDICINISGEHNGEYVPYNG